MARRESAKSMTTFRAGSRIYRRAGKNQSAANNSIEGQQLSCPDKPRSRLTTPTLRAMPRMVLGGAGSGNSCLPVDIESSF
jgi:hypothetical protein